MILIYLFTILVTSLLDPNSGDGLFLPIDVNQLVLEYFKFVKQSDFYDELFNSMKLMKFLCLLMLFLAVSQKIEKKLRKVKKLRKEL